FVAEYGRQPWTISEVLPTFLSASSLTTADLWFSILSISLFYTVLLVIEVFLMLKFTRIGPSSLKTGRYHFETNASQN
ncbi:MAG: cytochrome ubiquinol oxidase subunit I, partial [Shewanella sp.]